MIKTEDKIFIEFNEAIKAGIPKGTLDAAINRGSKSWVIIKDPTDKRKVLIEYTPLKTTYKILVINKICGGLEPDQFLQLTKVKQLLVSNDKDRFAISNFINSDGSANTEEKRNSYIKASMYASLLSKMGIKEIKKLGFESSPSFYNSIISLIKADGICLPASYDRLRRLIKAYKRDGATALIDKRGGAHNVKILSAQQSVLNEIFSKPNQFDAQLAADLYNKFAINKGWKSICSRTALNHFEKYKLRSERQGFAVWRDSSDYSVKRHRPTAPNMLWVGDGTPYELLYHESGTNKSGNTVQKYYKRLVVYVVIDAFNDYVVGFSIGETESIELAKEAWKNACTSHAVLPHQIKTDHFAFKDLSDFYRKVARKEDFYTPAAVGNARDKVIEPFFARLQHRVTKFHSNYSGHNITAKQQPNREYLDKIKNTFPDRAKLIEQIQTDIYIWNCLVTNKEGVSRSEQYINADHSNDRPLTDLTRLELFGKLHNYTNQFTNKGLNVTINGVQRRYMLFTDQFQDTIGTKYSIIYDENDLSKILATAPKGKMEIRFVVPEDVGIPMALMDMKEGDRTRLNEQLAFKKRQRERLIEDQIERKRVLKENNITELDDPEKIAQLMFTDAKGLQKPASYQAQNAVKGFVSQDDKSVSKKKRKIVEGLEDKSEMYKTMHRIMNDPSYIDYDLPKTRRVVEE